MPRRPTTDRLSLPRRATLLLRTTIGLGLAALLLIGLPTLIAWWWMGGPLGWQHGLVGLLVGGLLIGGGGLLLGWAFGKRLRDD